VEKMGYIMRIPLIAGNWKMNLTHMEAIQFVQNFGYDFRRKKNCEICICPPFTALRSIKNIIDSDRLDLKIGAQGKQVRFHLKCWWL